MSLEYIYDHCNELCVHRCHRHACDVSTRSVSVPLRARKPEKSRCGGCSSKPGLLDRFGQRATPVSATRPASSVVCRGSGRNAPIRVEEGGRGQRSGLWIRPVRGAVQPRSDWGALMATFSDPSATLQCTAARQARSRVLWGACPFVCLCHLSAPSVPAPVTVTASLCPRQPALSHPRRRVRGIAR